MWQLAKFADGTGKKLDDNILRKCFQDIIDTWRKSVFTQKQPFIQPVNIAKLDQKLTIPSALDIGSGNSNKEDQGYKGAEKEEKEEKEEVEEEEEVDEKEEELGLEEEGLRAEEEELGAEEVVTEIEDVEDNQLTGKVTQEFKHVLITGNQDPQQEIQQKFVKRRITGLDNGLEAEDGS